MRNAMIPFCLLYLSIVLAHAPATMAQVMVATDESFSVQYAQPLVVDTPGVLDNDLLDGEAAFEMGAIAELLIDAAHGALTLNPDGSFTYAPDSSFTGLDSFVYAAMTANASDQATVFLSACGGGPDVFFCWKEGAFLDLAAQLGYFATVESFEGAVWENARSPYSAPGVTSLGLRWTSNYPDNPPANPITTSLGAARTGGWGVYDAEHGYATGSAVQCDVDVPPDPCLYHDGFSAEVVPGMVPLVGIGGYVRGTYLANVAIVIDDTTQYGGGHISNFQFFGVVDTRADGFRRFSFQEQDGKVGQALFIWGDDFTLLTTEALVAATPDQATRFFFAGAGPNPAAGATTWRFALPLPARVELAVYDVRGRLVRVLSRGTRGAGEHAVGWDGRDTRGRAVAAGTYFGQLKVTADGPPQTQVRKLIILH